MAILREWSLGSHGTVEAMGLPCSERVENERAEYITQFTLFECSVLSSKMIGHISSVLSTAFLPKSIPVGKPEEQDG
jgi:hypothetical protein